jgi:hypothetical protein
MLLEYEETSAAEQLVLVEEVCMQTVLQGPGTKFGRVY